MSGSVGRSRPQDADRYVGGKVRERRIMLGLTQQQLAAAAGVTYQQLHKYERGINRLSAGRLYTFSRALGVDVGYFFEGASSGAKPLDCTAEQRMLLDLAKNFLPLPKAQQEALAALTRALANAGHANDNPGAA